MSRKLALQDDFRMTASLSDVIVQAIKVCFSSMMDNKEALLAAVTLTKFKIRSIREEEKKYMVRAMLTTECHGLPLEDQQHNAQHDKEPADSTDFFSFEEEDCAYSAETEVMEYLKSSGSELSVLRQFPQPHHQAHQWKGFSVWAILCSPPEGTDCQANVLRVLH